MRKISLFLLTISLAALLGTHALAQDDIIIPESDDETFVPPPVNSDANNPPVILDEGDASEVSDVEEYDG